LKTCVAILDIPFLSTNSGLMGCGNCLLSSFLVISGNLAGVGGGVATYSLDRDPASSFVTTFALYYSELPYF